MLDSCQARCVSGLPCCSVPNAAAVAPGPRFGSGTANILPHGICRCYSVRGEVAVAPSLRFGSGTPKYSATRHVPWFRRAGGGCCCPQPTLRLRHSNIIRACAIVSACGGRLLLPPAYVSAQAQHAKYSAARHAPLLQRAGWGCCCHVNTTLLKKAPAPWLHGKSWPIPTPNPSALTHAHHAHSPTA